MALPRVANVDFSRLKIDAGDRVIVRYRCDLSREELKRLRDAVSKWAGEEVRVLLVDERKFDVSVEKAKIVKGPEPLGTFRESVLRIGEVSL